MKIVCKCGNVSNLINIDTSVWDNPDSVRQGYEVFENRNDNLDIDSQFNFCYIVCKKCGNKIAIST